MNFSTAALNSEEVEGFKRDCRQFAVLQSLTVLVHVLSHLNYLNVNPDRVRIDL